MAGLKFEVGDDVIITNDGQTYSTFDIWVKEYAPAYYPTWKSGYDPFKNHDVVQVFAASACMQGHLYLVGKYNKYKSKFECQVIGEGGLTAVEQPEQVTDCNNVVDLTAKQTDYAIGDIVRIVDFGKSYGTYEDWFAQYAPNYFKKGTLQQGDWGQILAIGKHEYEPVDLYLIENIQQQKYCLVSAKGLEPYDPTVDYSPTPEFKYAIGETIKITDSGKKYSGYDKWVEKNAPKYLSLYQKPKVLGINEMSMCFIKARGKHLYSGRPLYLVGVEPHWLIVIGEEGIALHDNGVFGWNPVPSPLPMNNPVKTSKPVKIKTYDAKKIPPELVKGNELTQPIFLKQNKPSAMLSKFKSKYVILSWIGDACIMLKKESFNNFTLRIQMDCSGKNNGMLFIRARLGKGNLWSEQKSNDGIKYITLAVSESDMAEALADATRAVMRFTLSYESTKLNNELGG